jgi:hypothetical protein
VEGAIMRSVDPKKARKGHSDTKSLRIIQASEVVAESRRELLGQVLLLSAGRLGECSIPRWMQVVLALVLSTSLLEV